MTYKGVVETKNRQSNANKASSGSEYFNLRFNGIIFPQPVSRICSLGRAVLKQSHQVAESISVTLTSDSNSHPFSHKQVLGQIIVGRDDTYQVRID